MAVEKVISYRSTDGVLHDTEKACVARNYVLESRPKIKASLFANADATEGGLYDEDAICAWVLKCALEIHAILTQLTTQLDEPRRTRRTKADMALEKAAQAVLQAQNGAKAASEQPSQSLADFAAQEVKNLSIKPEADVKSCDLHQDDSLNRADAIPSDVEIL